MSAVTVHGYDNVKTYSGIFVPLVYSSMFYTGDLRYNYMLMF